MDMLWGMCPGSEKSKCKGPDVGAYLKWEQACQCGKGKATVGGAKAEGVRSMGEEEIER